MKQPNNTWSGSGLSKKNRRRTGIQTVTNREGTQSWLDDTMLGYKSRTEEEVT